MKYKIVTITKDRKRYENTITNNEYIDLRKSIEILKIYIDVFLLNYNIKKTCEDYNVTCKKSNNDTSHFAEINRLVLTLLSSFYMYIEFNEKKIIYCGRVYVRNIMIIVFVIEFFII